ncbi:MAG: phosphoadenosine phosphosulfate reductase family protein, partial [Candidatus Ornithomonoglobus sp.]
NNDNDDKRRLFERCEKQAKIVVNPIIDWTETDIWDYIKSENISCNPLYCNGFNRVGCIGCPMAGKKRYHEFMTYPKYEQLYIHAFDRMLQKRKADGKDYNMTWQTGENVFRWWLGEDFNQYRIEDVYDMEELGSHEDRSD